MEMDYYTVTSLAEGNLGVDFRQARLWQEGEKHMEARPAECMAGMVLFGGDDSYLT